MLRVRKKWFSYVREQHCSELAQYLVYRSWTALVVLWDTCVEGQIRKNDRMYFSVEVLQIHLFLNLTGFQLAISFINSGRKPTDLKVTFSRIIIWLGKQSFPFRYIWCTAVVSSSYCVTTSSPWC